jgi:hypothetical protein
MPVPWAVIASPTYVSSPTMPMIDLTIPSEGSAAWTADALINLFAKGV